jgi:hypothetical protein
MRNLFRLTVFDISAVRLQGAILRDMLGPVPRQQCRGPWTPIVPILPAVFHGGLQRRCGRHDLLYGFREHRSGGRVEKELVQQGPASADSAFA